MAGNFPTLSRVDSNNTRVPARLATDAKYSSPSNHARGTRANQIIIQIRKIRCDALPQGCSHCAQQDTPCYVTDRVTGRTEKRGYLLELEEEKNQTNEYIKDLERILRESGIEVISSSVSPHPPAGPLDCAGNPIQDPRSRKSWRKVGTTWAMNHSQAKSEFTPTFPRNLLQSRPEDSHLGLRGPCSALNGTRLSILGMTVDMKSLEAPDSDEPPDADPPKPLYNKSTRAFLQSTMNVNPPLKVDLPDRETAFTYCQMYFRTLYCFLPTLHQPTTMNLVSSPRHDVLGIC